MDQIKIGKFIAELRKNKNMTQEQLGEKLGVSFKTISKWENGRGMPELSTLKPLSEELGVSINEILSGEKLKKQDYQEKFEENIVNTLNYSNKKIKSIKHIFILLVVFILFILLTLFVLYKIDITRMKNNQPVLFSTWGFEYVPPINLNPEKMEDCISNYLINQDEKNQLHDNEKSFVAMRTYFIDEREDRVYIYAWILQEKYYEEDGKVKKDSGYSIPHKFELYKVDDNYVVTDYTIPRDGSYYERDMKNIFPKNVLDDMYNVHSDGTIEKLSLKIEHDVNLYFKTNYTE